MQTTTTTTTQTTSTSTTATTTTSNKTDNNKRTRKTNNTNNMRHKNNHHHNQHKRSKAVPKNKRVAVPAKMMDDDKDQDGDPCLICCEPIRIYAVGSCDHRNICGTCCLRRRVLYNQQDCCLCKQSNESVVFTSDASAPFSSFNIGLLASIPNAPGIHFGEPEAQQEIMKFFALRCPICEDQSFTSIFALKEHVKKHQLHYCSLCLTHKKVFLNEQTLYTRTDLKAHLKPGNRGGKTQNGEKEVEHQFCLFCKKRFFDKDQLYSHLHDKHEKCHVCEKHGNPNQYFDNYTALERHFGSDHFLCKDAGCLEKKFVVFSTALDLQAHEIAIHVSARKMSKAEKREASKLDVGLVFSSSSATSSPASPAAAAPASQASTAAHRNTNEPLINFAEHQAMSESWNFPSLPGSGNEVNVKQLRPVILGRNEWSSKNSSSKPSSSEAWPTLPSSGQRRAAPPSPPPELPGYGGYYGGRDYTRSKRGQQVTTRWGL